MRSASRASALMLGLVVGCAVDSPSDGDGGGSSGAGGAGRGGASAGGTGAGSAGKGTGASGGTAAGSHGTSGSGTSAGTSGAGAGGSPAVNGGTANASGGTGGAAAGGSSAGASAGMGAVNTGGNAGANAAGAGGNAGSGTGGDAAGTGGGSGSSASGGAGGTAGGGDDDRCNVANQTGSEMPGAVSLSGNLGTHDPVVIAAHGQFYLFATGDELGAKTSTNLTSWQGVPDVFSGGSRPDWIADEVPGATNLWAPDISYFGGQYHLYYSASTFGCNVSCIGHATRPALNSGSWTDHGSVVCSNPGATCQGNRPDNWNAIDPNVIVDREGTPWLAFGSFWGGLKLIELDQNGDRVGNTLISIAARPNDGGALEAPFIVRRCGYYYLFVSWDTCCQGEDSTYNTRVGRSESVDGPYVDKQGTPLMQGGGTLVLQGNTRWRGPGHNAVLFTDAAAYNVYHSYDADNDGNPVLRISELVFDEDGWPISGGP